jgi:enoyl-CoA hydratase
VAWAALVPPNCYPAYTFAKRALQATTMAAIDAAARLDRDWLSRGMSDPASLRAHALRYRELKGREIPGRCPAKNLRHDLVRVMNVGSAAREESPLLPQLQT